MTKKVVFMAMICLFAFTSCELLNPKDPDFLDKLYDEIAYANAEKLTRVTMDVAPAAGSSTPTSGLINNPAFRLGFWFPISYHSSAEYQFDGWLAFIKDDDGFWIEADESIVKFESAGSPVTRVMINTKNEVILRPKAEERPFIEATNLVWGRNEYRDYTVMIKFSRPMNPDSINWHTISIKGTVNNSVTEYNDKSFVISRLADNGTVLTLTPIGDFVIPFSTVEITLKRITDNNEIGVSSSEGISLTKDIILRYNCGHSINPNKPKFAGSAKLATKNGDTWTVWDGNTDTYNNTNDIKAVPESRNVFIVFLPDPGNRPVTGVRITETTIRRVGQSNDLQEGQEIKFNPITINIDNTNIDETLASDFYGQVNVIAVPYRLRSSNLGKEQDFGGVHLKVELYDGFSFSDDDLDGSQYLKTKFAAQQMGFILVAGADVSIIRDESGNTVKIGDNIVYHHQTESHALPFQPSTENVNGVRNVKIENFWIGETQVTEWLYKEVYNWAIANEYKYIIPNSISNGDEFPVVSGNNRGNIIVWCNAYSEMLGLDPVYLDSNNNIIRDRTLITADYTLPSNWATRNGFRLPFEIEWDYAARGGNNTAATNGTPWNFLFSGSNTWQDVASFSGTFQPVMQKNPNNLGLYDMSGNADELVWDNNGTINSTTSITGPDTGSNFILKGGSWNRTVQDLNSRRTYGWTSSSNARGFRVARNGD